MMERSPRVKQEADASGDVFTALHATLIATGTARPLHFILVLLSHTVSGLGHASLSAANCPKACTLQCQGAASAPCQSSHPPHESSAKYSKDLCLRRDAVRIAKIFVTHHPLGTAVRHDCIELVFAHLEASRTPHYPVLSAVTGKLTEQTAVVS